jgi:methyl-accepting chemotaxis protein
MDGLPIHLPTHQQRKVDMRIKREKSPAGVGGKRRFTISAKLTAGFFAVLALTSVLGFTSFQATGHATDAIEELLDVQIAIQSLADHSDELFFEAESNRKQYILSYKAVGFEQAHDDFLSVTYEAAETIKVNMAEVEALARTEENKKLAQEIAVLVEEYVVDVELMEEGLQEQGTKDVGANGEMVTAAEAMDEAVFLTHNEHIELLLEQTRVSEKNYLLRGTEEYVTATEENLTAMETAVRSAGLTPAAAEEIVALSEVYRTSFDKVVEADLKVDEVRAKLAGVIDEVGPKLNTIKENSQERVLEGRTALEDVLASQKTQVLVFAVAAIVVGLLVAFTLSRSLSRSARAMVAAANKIAEEDLASLAKITKAVAGGDLTMQAEMTSTALVVKSNDEMGDLATAFNQMIAALGQTSSSVTLMVSNLRDIVGQASQISSDLGGSSQALPQGAEESARAASEVSTTMESVARGATDQTQTTERLAMAVEEIVREVTNAAEAVAAAAAASGDAANRAETGQEQISQAVKAMERITNSITRAAETVADVGTQSAKVSEIVDLIRSIASQTNLLALNAAIEAARAGELGRGFAVVASEVKSLAEESASSTEQIASIVGQMQSSVEQAVSAMNQGKGEVDAGSSVVTGAGQAFTEIVKAVGVIATRVEGVAASAARVKVSAQQIADGVSSLVSVATENSAATEQVAAASEQAAATAEEIGATSEELSRSGDELTKTMGRFRL